MRLCKHILIVDDSPEDCSVYQRYLKTDVTTDYVLYCADIGADGLAMCHEHRLDCIILDYHLPDMNGIEFLEALHSQNNVCGVALVMLTGLGNEEIAVEAMKAGAQDYLIKDKVTATSLKHTVHNAIDIVTLQQKVKQQQEELEYQYQREQQAHIATEEALQQVASILESITDGFFAVDREWCITYVNREAEQQLQCALQELVGKCLWDTFPGLIAPPFEIHYHQAMNSQESVTFEEYDHYFDRWFDVRVYPSTTGVSVYFCDVTERKQTEALLRQREQEFVALAENAPDVITRFDQSLRYIYANAEIRSMTGIAQHAFLGKTNEELGLPDSFCNMWGIHLYQVFVTGTPAMFEFSLITPEGMHYYEARLVAEFGSDGVVSTVMGIARDITKQYVSNQRLQSLMDVSTTLSSSLDYQETLNKLTNLVVPSLADWCCITLLESSDTVVNIAVSMDDMLKEDLVEVFEGTHTHSSSTTKGPLHAINTGRTEYWETVPLDLFSFVESQETRSTVRNLPFSSVIIAPLSLHGKNIGAISLAMNGSGRYFSADEITLIEEIAIRAATAIENARLYQRAQEGIDNREMLMSIASHEMKNSLTNLIARLELMRYRAKISEHLTGEDNRDLVIMLEQSKRVNTLLSQLLDLSRIEAGQFGIEYASLDLSVVVQRIVIEVEPTVRKHTLIAKGMDSPQRIMGDPLSLEQVFRNLLSNAIKYSPNGGTIHIDIQEDEQYVCVQIADEGVGIAEEDLSHIFNQFYRVKTAQQHAVGSGLGLFVVREIVRHHQGHIEVDSKLYQGSTFRVYLPLLST
ncbi:MAG: ATP-binding protein [Chloroflexota bacterium]